RERKLLGSRVALARFMKELLGQKVEAFLVAQREGGEALAEHLTRSIDGQSGSSGGGSDDSDARLVTRTESSTFAPPTDVSVTEQPPTASLPKPAPPSQPAPPARIRSRPRVARADARAEPMFAELRQAESLAPPRRLARRVLVAGAAFGLVLGAGLVVILQESHRPKAAAEPTRPAPSVAAPPRVTAPPPVDAPKPLAAPPPTAAPPV